MTISSLTVAPTPPTRNDPDNFRDDADAFVSWEANNFVPELNTIVSEINSAVIDINLDSTAATEAQEYTAAVVGAAWYNPATGYTRGQGAIGSNGYTYVSVYATTNTGHDPVSDDGTYWRRVTGPFPMTPETTSSAVDITLTATSADMQIVTMTSAAKVVNLPDATTLRTGLVFTVFNTGIYDFTIKDDGGDFLAIVPSDTAISCYLLDTSTAVGTWRFSQAPPLYRVYAETPVAWNASANPNMQAFVVLDESTLIGIYNDQGDSNKGYAVAISAVDGAILDGPVKILDEEMNNAKAVRLSATEVFIACFADISNVVKGIVVEYDSGTLSITGSATTIINLDVSSYFFIAALDSQNIAVASRELNSTNKIRGRVVNWSGSAITVAYGPADLVATDVLPQVMIAVDSTHFIVGGHTDYLYSYSYSGSSFTQLDAEQMSAQTAFQYIVKLSETIDYVFYAVKRQNSSTEILSVVRLNKANYTFTILTPAQSGTIPLAVGACCLSNKIFMLLYYDSTTYRRQLYVYSWDENAVLLKYRDIYDIGYGNIEYEGVFALTATDVITSYADPTASSYETTQRIKFIGF